MPVCQRCGFARMIQPKSTESYWKKFCVAPKHLPYICGQRTTFCHYWEPVALSSTSFSVFGGEQRVGSCPLLTDIWLWSSLPSLELNWSWMYVSCSRPGLLWDRRVSSELPSPLPMPNSGQDSNRLPGFRDISTGPGGHRKRQKPIISECGSGWRNEYSMVPMLPGLGLWFPLGPPST